MIGDEMNKALVQRLILLYKKRGMRTFTFEWSGTRVPKTVTFPEGLEKTVQYMRDGVLAFTDNTSAVYERLEDIYPKQPQSVLIAYTPPMHKKA